MAWELGINGGDVPLKSATDLSAAQYYAVKLSADETVVVCSSTSDKAIGVVQNKPLVGSSARSTGVTVRMYGVTKWLAGGTVAYGDRVGTDGSGKCVAKTSADDLVAGICLRGAASGEYAIVALTPNGQRSA